MSSFLTLRDVRSGYAGSVVLHEVDLEVEEGGVVALLGRNGVGKSTLISTVMGLLRPYSGSIQVAGRELAGGSGRARAAHRPDRPHHSGGGGSAAFG